MREIEFHKEFEAIRREIASKWWYDTIFIDSLLGNKIYSRIVKLIAVSCTNTTNNSLNITYSTIS